jgi:hypothetical protein
MAKNWFDVGETFSKINIFLVFFETNEMLNLAFIVLHVVKLFQV